MESNYPGVEVDGEHFVPPGWRQITATTLQFAMWGIVILLFAGERIFNAVGIQPPELYRQLQENQLMAFGMVWFVGSTVIANIMKTGAFEVFINGELIHSKVQTGQLPQLPAIEQGLAAAGYKL